MRINENGIWGV
jgi:hypothetical protein